MINLKKGVVTEIISHREGLTELEVKISHRTYRAINYTDLSGEVKKGDEVIVNTSAVELGLGTGDHHFVLWNLSQESVIDTDVSGHIMKLRYTPLQLKVLSVEEQDSSYHQTIQKTSSLAGMPVVIGTLHSQLPAVAATAKKLDNTIRLAYIMTDGGALPIVFSRLVYELKKLGLIDVTITSGHAYGGDLEAVNIYGALLAAKAVAQADITVVSMGPGIVGTETTFGHTGIEQGDIINAVGNLEGVPVAIPRIHFKDKRSRHMGISHHTLTALSKVALRRAVVTLPEMDDVKTTLAMEQLKTARIPANHDIEIINARTTLPALKELPFTVTTMGRTVKEEPEFFMAAGAAAIFALGLLNQSKK